MKSNTQKLLLVSLLFFVLSIGAAILVEIIDVLSTQDSRHTEEITHCKDLGGIPIISDWYGSLADCVFPPEKCND